VNIFRNNNLYIDATALHLMTGEAEKSSEGMCVKVTNLDTASHVMG